MKNYTETYCPNCGKTELKSNALAFNFWIPVKCSCGTFFLYDIFGRRDARVYSSSNKALIKEDASEIGPNVVK